ncbi:glycosyltransferase [Hydrogenothermus marinus]|uniref:Glycosyltransferase involved in cell wall biosynthesis n=1 Tax=Hydrogenothermus marinus TaxID=133270 RepID=A0A3M0B7E9_9AQUI|nr:glycosyltransferase [Hydrogenothermus marinus]RMA93313.1 glycosyltransferase involved in cell wall biosynthesis [Hydrogenothermus marinus]
MSKKILLITSRIPYPPFGGDRLKNFNLLKILSKYYEVHLVTITDEIPTDETKKVLEKYTTSCKIFKKSKFDFLLSTSRAIFNKEPLQVNYYYFKDVQEYINSISKDMDCIIATLVRTAKYSDSIDKPKIFDMADSIGLNYKRSSARVKSLFWKSIYMFESKRLLRYEKEMINKYDKTLLFNREEIKYFNLPNKIKFIPHGVNEALFTYDDQDEKYKNYVAFFGKMDYQPNIDAVIWFTENVLNKLNLNIKFIIIGVNPTKKIKDLARKYRNVEVAGFVEDPYLILKSSLCVVAPMQTGGGIQNKVLESMALGTINIVSSLAAAPIGAKDKRDYLILDDPVEIANVINDIFRNRNKYAFLKKNSRKFIKEHFTWSLYEKVYIETIEEVIDAHKK